MSENNKSIEILALIVALMGGVPGCLQVYNWFSDAPQVEFKIQSIEHFDGEKNEKDIDFLLVDILFLNNSSIPISYLDFQLLVSGNGNSYKFYSNNTDVDRALLKSSCDYFISGEIINQNNPKIRCLLLKSNLPVPIALNINSYWSIEFFATDLDGRKYEVEFDNVPIKYSQIN